MCSSDLVAANNSGSETSGQFGFSNNGTFVYLSGKALSGAYPISWLDSAGKLTPVVAEPGAYGSPRISPDGKLLSVAGGGDTVAALAAAGVEDKFSYVSTAGGAFLEWMEGKALPGVAALIRAA